MFSVGSVTGDGGLFSSGPAPPEQRAPGRQPAAYSAPPARQQPPPAEEEEEANDYDSDEASKYTSSISHISRKLYMCVCVGF